ncbi:MAG: HAD family hydrolase [Halobacteriota archaeon]
MDAERPALKKAIIFDCDGVLVDSMPYYYKAWSVAFATQGITLSKDEFYEREGEKRTKSVKEIFERSIGYSPSARVSEEIISTMRDTFFKSFKPKLFPCTRELLMALVKKHNMLGLVTGSESLAEMFGPESDLLSLFHTVVTGPETKEGKPASEPYEQAIQRLRLPRSCCYAVENAPLGIQSAKAAGLFCFAVRNTSPLSASKLKRAGADVICDSNKELMRWLV